MLVCRSRYLCGWAFSVNPTSDRREAGDSWLWLRRRCAGTAECRSQLITRPSIFFPFFPFVWGANGSISLSGAATAPAARFYHVVFYTTHHLQLSGITSWRRQPKKHQAIAPSGSSWQTVTDRTSFRLCYPSVAETEATYLGPRVDWTLAMLDTMSI